MSSYAIRQFHLLNKTQVAWSTYRKCYVMEISSTEYVYIVIIATQLSCTYWSATLNRLHAPYRLLPHLALLTALR